MTLYAIGDIHGQRALLEGALDKIDRDGGAQHELICIGDYIDRGPDSRGVLDLLMGEANSGRHVTCLTGNHDRMFADFLTSGTVMNDNIKSRLSWINPRLGGLATLASYGIDAREDRRVEALWAEAQDAVPDTHLEFLKSLPLYAERDGLLFVHAGIRPGVALQDQVENDLIWIRDDFLLHREAFDWLVVHGHTAVDGADHRGNRVNLDGGAGYGRPLRVAAFENGEVYELTETGRARLVPGTWGALPA